MRTLADLRGLIYRTDGINVRFQRRKTEAKAWVFVEWNCMFFSKGTRVA
jgi:hypothetical protein